MSLHICGPEKVNPQSGVQFPDFLIDDFGLMVEVEDKITERERRSS